jgi:hypothetical protein
VAVTLLEPPQPAETAKDRRFAFVWFDEIANVNVFDLPLKFVIAIVAGLAPTPANVRTAESFNEIVAVDVSPNSVLI